MVSKQEDNQLSFSIFNIEMTVDSLRSSGYKSPTYAIAELIDNSIESGAKRIEVFGFEGKNSSTGRFTLQKLAVLDNGAGMDALTLRGSLRYGYGTRQRRRGIGRFGLGLPNSSMSQARRVDVWSWQEGERARHTWLSIDDIEKGATEIPEPDFEAIPDDYRKATRNGFGESGTLIVWSDLDRVGWKQVSTTFKHTEHLLGRIYRRFLASESDRLDPDDPRNNVIGSRRSITCIPVRRDPAGDIHVLNDKIIKVRPNDPLYLMQGTSCPEEFGIGPMFVELAGSPFCIPVKYKGGEYEVRVRAAYARPHVRDSSDADASWPEKWEGRDAGPTPWGEHAKQNLGISVMRAHREIDIDDSWTNEDTRERWWTVEVDFPTELDELFGVTNNKQGAMTFRRLAKYDWNREALPGEKSPGDVRRRMQEDGDDRIYLLDIWTQINRAIGLMRTRVEESRQARGGKAGGSGEDNKADKQVTRGIKRRIQKGHKGESDRMGTSGSQEEHIKLQRESLVEKHHLDEEDALKRIDETIREDSRVRWIQSRQDNPGFFSVEALPNVIQVALNTNHPVYHHLYDIMHSPVEELNEDKLQERLAKAAAAFRILLYSWGRYEEEQSEKNRRRIQDVRWEWGKYAQEFFDEDEDEDDLIPPVDLV